MMDDDVFSLDNDSDGYVPEPKVRSLHPDSLPPALTKLQT